MKSLSLSIATLYCSLLGSLCAAPSLPYHYPVEKQLKIPRLTDDDVVPSIVLPPIDDIASPKSGLSLVVTEFKFIGNSVFSDEELLTVISKYVGQKITTNELHVIKNRLTQLYIDNGYINSGAVLPDQEVEKGIITYKITEGSLSVVQLSGQDNLHHGYIYNRVLLGVDNPLNVKALQKQLFLLQQDTRIKRVNAKLKPGVSAGQSILYLEVEENKLYRTNININNHRSPSVGSDRIEIDYEHLSLFGYGDTFKLRLGITKGLDDVDFQYTLPITASGSGVGMYYRESESEVIEKPFSTLDVESRSETIGISSSWSVYKDLDGQLDLGLNFEKRKSTSYLLGLPFSFDAGPKDGVSRVSALRFSQSWFQRGSERVFAGRSTFSHGIDAIDATINNGSAPDGKFQTWLGQLQWLERYPGNQSELVMRGNIQLADDPLLPLEQFAIGGANSVRGYRENQLVGDSGVNYSIEYRYPLYQENENYWQVAVFTDYGRVWNKERTITQPNDIYSAGIGIRWTNNKGAGFDIYWGESLREAVGRNNNLQDDGVHFQFYIEAF